MPAGKQKRDQLVQAAATYQPTLKDTVGILNQGTNTLIALKQLEMQQQGPYEKLSAYGTARGVQDSLTQIGKDANLVRTAHKGAMGDIVTIMTDEFLDADSLAKYYTELETYDVSSDTSGSLAIEKSSMLKLAEALVDKKTKSNTMSSELDTMLSTFEAERTKSVVDGNLVFNASETEFTINNMSEIKKKIYAAEKRGLDVDAEQSEERMKELQKFFYLMDGLKEFDAMDETQLAGNLAQEWDKFVPHTQWDVVDMGKDYRTSSGKVITGSVSDALLTSMDLLESGDVVGAEEYYNAASQRRASLFAGEVSRGKGAAKAGVKALLDKATLARKKFGDNLSDLAQVINNQTVGKNYLGDKGALFGIVDPLPSAAQGQVGWQTMQEQAARNVLSIIATSDSSIPGFDSDLNDIAQKWQLEGSSSEEAVMILNQIRKYGSDKVLIEEGEEEQEEFTYKGEKYDLTNSLYDRSMGSPILYTPVGGEGTQLNYPGAEVYGKDADTIATQKYMVDVLNMFEKIETRPTLVDIANTIDPDGDGIANNPSIVSPRKLKDWFDTYGTDSSAVE